MWLLLALSACAGKDADTASPATFTEVRDEVLLPSCGFSSCHGSGTGGLTLDEEGSYDALVNAESVGKPGAILVIPGDPDGSYLVHKLEGGPDIVDDQMPPGGSMDDATIAAVRSWIEAGAADD